LQGVSKNWMLTKNIETSLIFSSFNSMICDHIGPIIFSYNIWEPIQKKNVILIWSNMFHISPGVIMLLLLLFHG
jgi:hypothetical protein